MQNKRGLNLLTRPKRRYQNQGILLEKEQTAKLIEIGIYLQQSRLKQSLSLDDIARQTKIQPRLLRAIEAGKMDQLPEPVFVQGYIKLFAQSLNLDGVELAKSFPVDKLAQPSAKSFYLWLKLPFLQLRPMHLYLLYACLIMGAVNSLSYLVDRPTSPSVVAPEGDRGSGAPIGSRHVATDPNQPSNHAELPQENLSLAATSGLNATEQWAELLPFLGRNGGSANDAVQVRVTLKEQSWLRVMADDQVAYEGVLNEGTQQAWTAKKQVTLRAGNAGGVLVTFNDKPEQALGLPGEVQEVTFKSDNQSSKQASTQALSISESGL